MSGEEGGKVDTNVLGRTILGGQGSRLTSKGLRSKGVVILELERTVGRKSVEALGDRLRRWASGKEMLDGRCALGAEGDQLSLKRTLRRQRSIHLGAQEADGSREIGAVGGGGEALDEIADLAGEFLAAIGGRQMLVIDLGPKADTCCLNVVEGCLDALDGLRQRSDGGCLSCSVDDLSGGVGGAAGSGRPFALGGGSTADRAPSGSEKGVLRLISGGLRRRVGLRGHPRRGRARGKQRSACVLKRALAAWRV